MTSEIPSELMQLDVTIGYQGKPGSYSFEAAKKFSAENKIGWDQVCFLPLVSSRNVCNYLKKQKIDFGVMAIYNSIVGEIAETAEALGNCEQKFELVAVATVDVNHCLFIKRGATMDSVDTIASHAAALAQTEKIRHELYPHCHELICEDTAAAAEMLADGILDENVGVLCSKQAGEINNLKLVETGLADMRDNKTMFGLFRSL